MAKRTSAGRRKVALAFILLFGPAFLLIFFSTRSCSHNFKTLEDFGALNDFEFIDIQGKKRTSKEFNNKILLITVIEESCPDSCSISLWHLNHLIYQNMSKSKVQKNEVRLITFVVDKEGNPTNLNKIRDYMMDKVENYDPKYWILASGESKQIYDITHNNQNLLKDGDEIDITHSYHEIMLLADKNLHLRMALRGNEEGMIRRMREHLALLQKQYDLKKK